MAGPYQPQLNPSVGSDFSGAPSGGIGQPIANALEYGGELLDQEIHRRRELDRDMQATAAGVALAQASTELDKAAIDARESAGPGGAGHTQSIDQMIDERSNQALVAIKDPHIRQVFQQRWAALKDQISTREYGWEAATRVDHLATNVKEATDTYARSQSADPTLTALPNQLASIAATIGSTAGLSDDQKHALVKEQQAAVVYSYAQGQIDKDPTELIGDAKTGKKGILESPDFNQYLDPKQIDALRNSANVEVRRRDAEQRQQYDREKAAAAQQISLLKKQASSGVVLTDDQLAQGAALAKQFDLGGDEWDLAVIKDQNDVNRQYRTATPTTLHHDLNELQAKVAAGKATAAEQVRLKNLQEFAEPAIARFNSDPFAAAAAAGDPAPELGDLTQPDPAKVQARVTWARAFAQSSGLVNVPYLSNDEAKIFTDRIKQGPAGQLDASTTLRNAFGGSVAMQIVKQIAPGNKDLELMVGLHPRVAELYKRGSAALEAKTVHLGSTADQQTGQADQQAMKDAFAAYAEAIPVDMQPALWRAAQNITAGVAAEWGHHEPTGDDLSGTFQQAMQRAGGMLGSAGQGSATGGFANWEGHYVWLPQNMGRAEFQTRMSRAGKADWVKAGGGEPHYMGSDGKLTPLSDSQISQLAHYRLQTVSPGVYRLLGPDGGHVVTKDGKPFQFDIRNLR
jgi:hypothetical protein